MSNGGLWNLKLTLKVNSLWIKVKAQNFVSQVLRKHTLKIWSTLGWPYIRVVWDCCQYIELLFHRSAVVCLCRLLDESVPNNNYWARTSATRPFMRQDLCDQGPVSQKSQKLFGPKKPFIKLRLAHSIKLVSYVAKRIKITITAKFCALRRLR